MNPEEQGEAEAEPSPDVAQRDRSTPPELRPDVPYTAQFHQGPLPSPEILRVYNELIPNAAERIFVVFENQAAHRMAEEREERIESFKLANRGLLGGGIVCTLALVVAGILAATGQGTAAAAVATLDMAAIAGAFIYGTARKSSQQEPSRPSDSGNDSPQHE